MKSHPASDQDNLVVIKANVQLRQTLFSTKISLNTESGYSKSHTYRVNLIKDADTGEHFVAYIYKNDTPNPRPSDEQFHWGAAVLSVESDNGKDVYLSGKFWTNRKWKNGLNTAGTISMSKKS